MLGKDIGFFNKIKTMRSKDMIQLKQSRSKTCSLALLSQFNAYIDI